MMTNRSGFCEGQPAAGFCHHPLALHGQFGSGARQVTAAKPQEDAWTEEREPLRWLLDAVPEAIYVKDTESRADAIVRDLLYRSAAKQLEPQAEDLNAVIQHSLWLVNFELTRSRISLAPELAADLPPVRLDKAKMEQVFINLFMNAIQAMPLGGMLSVKTSATRLNETLRPDAASGCFRAGDVVVVTEIQDTGMGIPEGKLPRVFEPFTKPTGVGTGLGLPVTKQIIDLHGGMIDIQPASTGGVRVTLMIKAENGG